MSWPNHNISVVVDGVQVRSWVSYEIKSSMLQPADSFSLRMPFNVDVWNLCKTDRPIKVFIDEVCILNGYLDERLVPEDDEAVEIVGRDRAGRLVQESAPTLNYSGIDMFTLIGTLAKPWFPGVTTSNARNRTLIRGRGKKAKAGGEPLKLAGKKKFGTRIEPGQTRMTVINDLCSQAGYLAWSSGDGTELIIGEPNYDQEIQFRFFQPAADSLRGDDTTVLGMGVRESTADRYSRIIVVGSGSGTDAAYGASVASQYAEVKNNPATPEGDGLDFSSPKRLIVQRAVASIGEARELAAREMATRDATGHHVTVRAPGHGQVIAGNQTTIFACDTLASVEDERTGTKGTYLITECTYRSSRQGGEETTLILVPKGTQLTST